MGYAMHTLHGAYETAIDRWLGQLPERLEDELAGESLRAELREQEFRRSS